MNVFRLGALSSFVALIPGALQAQNADESGALAVAEQALEFISEEDWVGVTDLMLDEALMFAVSETDGDLSYRVRTRAETRTRVTNTDLVERGFDPVVHVQNQLATVWLPYDFYIDGELSHCGVDAFTLLRTNAGWRIASVSFTVEQPPDCSLHPVGPPGN